MSGREEKLPPFGIRGLCSPETPFSVLQISEQQYNESLNSYPDSALTWLDEDDGELVTIGSGWELKERLQETVPLVNPRIKFNDPWTGRVDDRYIHIFDISESQTSKDVWREHEAYFSKSQASIVERRDATPSISPTIQTAKQPKLASTPVGRASYMWSPLGSTSAKIAKMEAEETDKIEVSESTSKPPAYLPPSDSVEGLVSELSNAAGLLHGASESLRSVAEKVRSHDQAPWQTVFANLKAGLGSIESFGAQMTVDTKVASLPASAQSPSQPSQDAQPFSNRTLQQMTDEYLTGLGSLTISPKTKLAHVGQEKKINTACVELLEDEGTLFDSSLLHSNAKISPSLTSADGQRVRDLERTVIIQLLALNRLETSAAAVADSADFQIVGMSESDRNEHRRVLTRLLLELHAAPDNRTSRQSIQGCMANSHQDSAASSDGSSSLLPPTALINQSKASETRSGLPSFNRVSILDEDTDVNDVLTAQHPPLMSLRKAKTFDVLRPGTGREMMLSRNDSFKQDHVGKPRPQVFDAETQRRRAFANTCFPTQSYTPGPGTTTLKVARPKFSFESDAGENWEVTKEIHSASRGHSTESVAVPSTISTEAVTVETTDAAKNPPVVVRRDGGLPSACELPGSSSWEQFAPIPTNPASSTPSHTGSDRNIQEELEKLKQYFSLPSREVNHGLHRHRSLTAPSPKQPEAGGLQRAHTVKASHPAARLNGPFSPLFPDPLTPKSFSEMEEKSSSAHVKHAQHRLPQRSMSERRPRSLHEPYRPNNPHRGFEPVWEGQDDLARTSEPNPGVVIVDARNFEPGTTEQDIRDLLADDCRTVIGINTLISCRIIATHPQVFAKLVIKDKTNADAVIDKYNNKWINGRPLKFEYARRGLDARINRLRGVMPPPNTFAPRHLRSVPDLRATNKETEVKPSFANFVSQSKPITTPLPTANANKVSLPPTPLPSQPVLPLAFAGNLIHDCEKQLMNMGYGQMDPALLSRLHVYACAANGDVHEAIEMIEDDRKAHDFDSFQKKVKFAREERWGKQDAEGDDSDADSGAYEEDLEKAIKLSMSDR